MGSCQGNLGRIPALVCTLLTWPYTRRFLPSRSELSSCEEFGMNFLISSAAFAREG